MSARMRDLLSDGFDQLRREPIAKRIRAVHAGVTVADSTRAVLVWEPRRVVPSYALPVDDVRGELLPGDPAGTGTAGTDAADAGGVRLPDVTGRPVLDPSIPFPVHSTPGHVMTVRAGGQDRPGAGFCPADPDLAGYVVLDFGAFDTWYEEDQPNVGHPHDPFHRIDVLPSSRPVRLELDGWLLAESSRPALLFETMLPTRFYLRREDIRAELIPSSTTTYCAYKGRASYWSASVGGRVIPDAAWTYTEPLHDATPVRDLIAFFDERVDLTLDGRRRERPVTPWSAPRAGDGDGAGPGRRGGN
ncbi:MAG: hypothetical protein JWL68_1753 [Actinomycetia bacterium]|nr:hypothetical protein [Actinomycetes bacterium]